MRVYMSSRAIIHRPGRPKSPQRCWRDQPDWSSSRRADRVLSWRWWYRWSCRRLPWWVRRACRCRGSWQGRAWSFGATSRAISTTWPRATLYQYQEITLRTHLNYHHSRKSTSSITKSIKVPLMPNANKKEWDTVNCLFDCLLLILCV